MVLALSFKCYCLPGRTRPIQCCAPFPLYSSSSRAQWRLLLREDRLQWQHWPRSHAAAGPGANDEVDTQRNVAALLAVLGVDQEVLRDILRRDPELLMVPCEDVAAALLHLKVALPTLDILELVRRRPSLLREKNGVRIVEQAIRDMEKLMPALPVKERLMHGQMWLTFRERMQYWEQVDAVADKPPIMYISVPGMP